MVTRGFFGRRRETPPRPIPPGQYLERGFPVLTAGPTQRVPLDQWTFTLAGVDGEPLGEWNWEQFRSLPETEIFTDIHCVTKWSKLDTTWKGVTIDDLLAAAGVTDPAPYLMAFSYGGYTTNLPTWDVIEGRGMVAYEFDGPAHRAGARRPGPSGRASSVLLEVRQVAARHPLHASGPARLLGTVRLSYVRRPLERATLLGRLAPTVKPHHSGEIRHTHPGTPVPTRHSCVSRNPGVPASTKPSNYPSAAPESSSSAPRCSKTPYPPGRAPKPGLTPTAWQNAVVERVTRRDLPRPHLHPSTIRAAPLSAPASTMTSRLTAPDGYQAQRSYSIALRSVTPGRNRRPHRRADTRRRGVALLPRKVVQPGDELEVRGPIGGPFTWTPDLDNPLFLIAGGSGIVPLRSILAHREAAAPSLPALLLYSAPQPGRRNLSPLA